MKGFAVKVLADAHRVSGGSTDHSMSAEQAVLLWFLILVQGARRVYESVIFSKPSTARMPLPIYFTGIAYYFVTAIAAWIEGIGEE
jgi:3-oxo-5-alpha-steroid 4-dehydrogenase 3